MPIAATAAMIAEDEAKSPAAFLSGLDRGVAFGVGRVWEDIHRSRISIE